MQKINAKELKRQKLDAFRKAYQKAKAEGRLIPTPTK